MLPAHPWPSDRSGLLSELLSVQAADGSEEGQWFSVPALVRRKCLAVG